MCMTTFTQYHVCDTHLLHAPVPGVLHGDSDTGNYKILSIIPCAIQWVPVAYLFYIQQCVYVNQTPKLYYLHDYLIFYFIKFYLSIYIWLCWVLLLQRLFSNCREQGLLSSCRVQTSHCGGFSCCESRTRGHLGAQQLWLGGSRAQAQQLWCTGLLASQHVGSSRTRD